MVLFVLSWAVTVTVNDVPTVALGGTAMAKWASASTVTTALGVLSAVQEWNTAVTR